MSHASLSSRYCIFNFYITHVHSNKNWMRYFAQKDFLCSDVTTVGKLDVIQIFL